MAGLRMASRALGRSLRAANYAVAPTATPVRAFAAAAPEADIVTKVFQDQQAKFRALVEKTKTLVPPVDGDAAAVEAYAAQKQKIMTDLKIPTAEARIGSAMDRAMEDSASVRSFIEYAENLRGTLGLADEEGVGKAVLLALNETEKEIGGPLLKSNAEGVSKLLDKLAEVDEKFGGDVSALESASFLESVQAEVTDLKEQQTEVAKKAAALS